MKVKQRGSLATRCLPCVVNLRNLAGGLTNLDAGVAALLEHHRQQLLKALRALRRVRQGTAVRADSGRLPSYAAYISVLLDTKACS